MRELNVLVFVFIVLISASFMIVADENRNIKKPSSLRNVFTEKMEFSKNCRTRWHVSAPISREIVGFWKPTTKNLDESFEEVLMEKVSPKTISYFAHKLLDYCCVTEDPLCYTIYNNLDYWVEFTASR
jgi:hypothetical protein